VSRLLPFAVPCVLLVCLACDPPKGTQELESARSRYDAIRFKYDHYRHLGGWFKTVILIRDDLELLCKRYPDNQDLVFYRDMIKRKLWTKFKDAVEFYMESNVHYYWTVKSDEMTTQEAIDFAKNNNSENDPKVLLFVKTAEADMPKHIAEYYADIKKYGDPAAGRERREVVDRMNHFYESMGLGATSASCSGYEDTVLTFCTKQSDMTPQEAINLMNTQIGDLKFRGFKKVIISDTGVHRTVYKKNL